MLLNVDFFENFDDVDFRHIEKVGELLHARSDFAQLEPAVLVFVHLLKDASQLPHLLDVLHERGHEEEDRSLEERGARIVQHIGLDLELGQIF